MNSIPFRDKLGMIMIIPLLVVVALVLDVWRDSAATVREAEDDRAIALAAPATLALPRLLLAETLFYDATGDGRQISSLERVLRDEIRGAVDDAVRDFREIPADARATGELAEVIEQEIAANERMRTEADQETLTRAKTRSVIFPQRALAEDAVDWLTEQEVDDANGSWRLLLVTAPNNITLLDAGAVALRALRENTLSPEGATFLRDAQTSYESLEDLAASLSPDAAAGGAPRGDGSGDLAELIALALARAEPTTASPRSSFERLSAYRLSIGALEGAAARERELAEDVARQAASRAAETRSRTTFVIVATAALMAIAIILMLVLARNITQRLRSVAEQARLLNSGVLSGAGNTAEGRDEIAVLGSAMDGMSDIYMRLVAQSEAIAAGRLDDEALREPLPGELGKALQRSIDLVAESSAQLLKEATHDELTGLLDRSGLNRAVQALSSMRGGEAAAAAFYIDLDGFKEVNDSFGHACGDAILVETATRLRSVARGDDVIARVGGDEFIVLAPDVRDVEIAGRIADRISEALGRPVSHAGRLVSVSASVGWAFAHPGQPLAQAIELADERMYNSKRARGRVREAEPDADGMAAAS